MSALVEECLQIAASQVGQQEHPKGSNWGHPVQDYLASCEIHVPAPWCMSFVVHCLRKAGIGSDQFPTSASCSQVHHWAKEHEKLVEEPQRGDVFLLLRPGGHAFHTGFVCERVADRFRTIEGNSDPQGGAEGYEVTRRNRPVHGAAFVRLGG